MKVASKTAENWSRYLGVIGGKSRIPHRRGTNPSGDANIQFCSIFQKVHEIEKNFGCCGGGGQCDGVGNDNV